MIRFDAYPYSQIRDALETVLGRVTLCALALVLGSALGYGTATRSFAGLLLGITELPMLAPMSILMGGGLLVFPVVFLYVFMAIKWQWPYYLTIICTLLMWWNVHKTIRWANYDSPSAKKMQKLVDEIERSREENAEQKK